MCTEPAFAFFHFEGNTPLSKHDLEISSNGGKTESPHNFTNRIRIMLCSYVLIGSMSFAILAISCLVTEIDGRAFVVFILSVAEISLALSIRVYCSEKINC